MEYYCWWLKSCTTWDVKNPVNNGIAYLSTGAGFLPSTVREAFFMFTMWENDPVWRAQHIFQMGWNHQLEYLDKDHQDATCTVNILMHYHIKDVFMFVYAGWCLVMSKWAEDGHVPYLLTNKWATGWGLSTCQQEIMWQNLLPLGSMYGIFAYIYHRLKPNVVKYTIHGS